ncbi:MAG: hypothetical protein Q7T50_01145 [Candidatus Magasanikbacteria bacterium]|nr:hypothetical protein [Candidatus Magasanikbacteria bacterium]
MKILKIVLMIVACFAVVFLVAYLSNDGTTPCNDNSISAPAPDDYNIAPSPSAPTPSTPENEEAEMIRKMKLNP